MALRASSQDSAAAPLVRVRAAFARRRLPLLFAGGLMVAVACAIAQTQTQGARQPPVGIARESVAVVTGASGDTVLLRAGSLTSPVRSGTQLTAGDRLFTRDGGRIALRFSDGAVMALHPNTEFRIDDYQYDTADQRSFLSLMRGALRTVTGVIGRRQRDDYRLNTPSATIGIRGTEYEARETVCPPSGCAPGEQPGLALRVLQGRVAVSNEAGSLEIGAGATGLVPDRRSPPVLAAQIAPSPAVLLPAVPPPAAPSSAAPSPAAPSPPLGPPAPGSEPPAPR
ncbi:MAG: FecR family protein [Burkholderiales bacterium]